MKQLPELFNLDDKLSEIDVARVHKQIQEEIAAAYRQKIYELVFQQCLTNTNQ